MLYRTLPRGGDRISALGFGCMRLPTQGGRIDEAVATRMLHRAIDEGVNYVDTAWPYHGGDSEPFVGRALGAGFRQRVFLATKLPSWGVKTAADFDRFLDEQLQRLQTTWLDYYLIHAIDHETFQRLMALGMGDFIERARRDGRVRRIGFSSHDSKKGICAIVDGYPWDFCLLQHNFLDENYQAGNEGLAHAAKAGLGVMVMEPLRGGVLARPAPAVLSTWARASTPRSPAEWALRWVWNKPHVVTVLSGMSEPAQLEENLRVASLAGPGSLTSEELALFEDVKVVYRSRMKVDCTSCGYCQPCPNGVEIAECFAQYNAASMFEDEAYARNAYGFRAGDDGGASHCIQCSTCEDLCPQHLPIPDKLAEVAAFFGR